MKRVALLTLSVVGLLPAPAQSQDYYLLIAAHSQKCAHVQAGSQDNGGTISQWKCGSQNYFRWKKRDVSGGYFQLQALHSNKCAQVNGASRENGAAITQWDCMNQPHFHWKQEGAEGRAGADTYYLVNRASGKCMHVLRGSNDDAAVITQWECVNQPNVKWTLSGRTGID